LSLTFDTILIDAAIEPTSVHLVRHQDTRYGAARTPYRLWREDKPAFELYQRIQHRLVFSVGNFVASFVVTPRNETLFIGLYRVLGIDKVPPGTLDPLGKHDVSGLNDYELLADNRLAEYADKLTIEWGQGYRSWVQRAGRGSKAIRELKREFEEEHFPGYLALLTALSEIQRLPSSWAGRLREAKGVYLLTCPRTHEHYVGSASGVGGFYERWEQHAAMGGDAVHFKSRDPADYQVSILEVAGSGALHDGIVAAEHLWMRKLQSTSMGLNGPIRSASNSTASG